MSVGPNQVSTKVEEELSINVLLSATKGEAISA